MQIRSSKDYLTTYTRKEKANRETKLNKKENRYVLSDLLRFVVVAHAHILGNHVSLLLRLFQALDCTTLLTSLCLHHLLDGTTVDLLLTITVLLN